MANLYPFIICPLNYLTNLGNAKAKGKKLNYASTWSVLANVTSHALKVIKPSPFVHFATCHRCPCARERSFFVLLPCIPFDILSVQITGWNKWTRLWVDLTEIFLRLPDGEREKWDGRSECRPTFGSLSGVFDGVLIRKNKVRKQKATKI